MKSLNASTSVAAIGVAMGRAYTRDDLTTFSNKPTHDGAGNHLGVPMDRSYRAHDGKTYDSTGAFLIGELERLDQKMHMPLQTITFGRDIDMRTDVTIGDDVSSFTLSTFASPGSLGVGNGIGNGKAWIGKSTTQIASVSVDIQKITFPLREWALELKYTIFELQAALRAGRPIDQQKYDALIRVHQMNIDEQVYIGDFTFGDTGLVNNSLVTNTSNAPAGAAGFTQWSKKSPVEILADINLLITTTWAASGWQIVPSRILLPPTAFSYLNSQLISTAGNQSILKFVRENNMLAQSGQGGQLEIHPLKWCIGAGVGGTIGVQGTVDRMVCYTKDVDLVRYPMTLLANTPLQYDGIYQKMTYYCKLGVVELVYPETISYLDGI